jgi:hypothetical protein
MSGIPTRPADNGPGITSQQTTTTKPPFELGSGTYKTAILANHASPGYAEFTYAGLQSAGGPGNYYNGHYAIISVIDFPANRLLSEFTLQFEFAKIGLSPNIYALKINNDIPQYGETDINNALTAKGATKCNFLIAMERVNYNTGNMSTEDPAQVINNDPGKLIALINNVLAKGVLLVDIKLRNLSVKCSSTNNISCKLGVIDLDREFVANVSSWYLLSKIGFIDAVHAKLAGQYMVLMVCFVGLTNGLTKDTKIELLKRVGLLSQNEQTYTFNTDAINNMLSYEVLKKQIMHYLVGKYSDTDDAAYEINKEYILGELFGVATRKSSDSSYGGKARRKHKKTRKHKPKSKKTRRKRSLVYHNLPR